MAARSWLTFSLLSLRLVGCSSVPSDGATLESPGEPSGAPAIESDASGFDLDADPGGATSASDASCAATTSKATAIPVDLFVMQDQSGSMKETTATGTQKWTAIKAAMKSFLADESSAGLGVGIQYFALRPAGSTRTSCNVADYAKAEVEIAPLPGVRAAIEASLDAHAPNGDTPTGPALQGALSHARAWSLSHPTHTVVVVLATDGMPTSCTPTDIPSIAKLAAAANAGAKPVRTYVIGVLADADLASGADANLHAISKAGNGGPALIVNTGADVTKEFLAALEKIRGASLACEYEVPKGPFADAKKVNVAVTLGGKTQVIPYVGSAAKCDAVAGGWYYDVEPSAGTPTKIITCDATCKALGADPSGTIDIQVGCATLVK